MRRMILVPLLIVFAVLAIAGGVGYWIYDGYTYYRTDDAQVTGNIVNVSAPMSGVLTTLSVKTNDTVSAGQSIGTITGAPVVGPNGTSSPATTDLTSPISGTVLQLSAVQGQGIAAGTPVLMVTNLNALTITAFVDESSIDNIQTNQSVDIHIDAYGSTSFTGHVQQIVQAAASEFSLLPTQDNASGNFTKVGQRVPVIITLDGNGGKDIVPGLSAEVTIHIH
jgi:multidrug resistance efflux pump